MRSLTRRSTFLAAGLAAAAIALSACGGGGGPVAAAQGDMTLGSDDAPVTVVEYASVTCGHCAAWNQQVWPDFKARFIDTGQVRFVFREFPTAPGPVAVAGFLLARCAGEERYFSVVDAIMRSQQEMAGPSYDWTNSRPVLLRIAQSAGMSESQFDQCVNDRAAVTAFEQRMQAAVAAGVNGTPYFMINGRHYTGDTSLAGFEAALAPLVGDAPAEQAG